MTNAESKKVDMFDRVVDYLNEKDDIVTTIAALPPLITKLSDLLIAINAKDEEKGSKTNGKTDAKNAVESALELTLFVVSKALFAYGRKNMDPAITSASEFSLAEIQNLTKQDLYSTAITIHNLAKDKVLTDWDVDAAKVTLLKTQAEAFKKASTEIRTAISDRVGAGKSLAQLFKEADDLIKLDIDPAVEAQIEKRPEFYNGYKSARVIWDRGGSHTNTSETPVPVPQPNQTPTP